MFITHQIISAGSHWIKLITDDGYQMIFTVRFEICHLILFHSCPRRFASRPTVHFSDNLSALAIILQYTSRRKGFIIFTKYLNDVGKCNWVSIMFHLVHFQSEIICAAERLTLAQPLFQRCPSTGEVPQLKLVEKKSQKLLYKHIRIVL